MSVAPPMTGADSPVTVTLFLPQPTTPSSKMSQAPIQRAFHRQAGRHTHTHTHTLLGVGETDCTRKPRSQLSAGPRGFAPSQRHLQLLHLLYLTKCQSHETQDDIELPSLTPAVYSFSFFGVAGGLAFSINENAYASHWVSRPSWFSFGLFPLRPPPPCHKCSLLHSRNICSPWALFTETLSFFFPSWHFSSCSPCFPASSNGTPPLSTHLHQHHKHHLTSVDPVSLG